MKVKVISLTNQIVEIEIDSPRNCGGCQYWCRFQPCALLRCDLPNWVSPVRPDLCFAAQAAAERRQQ